MRLRLAAALGLGMSAMLAPLAAGPAPVPGPTEKAAEAGIAVVRDMIVDALYLTADEYWHAGDLEAVIPIMREVLELDPQYADAWGTAAWVSMRLGKTEQARRFWEEGMKANPQDYALPMELALWYYTYNKDTRDLEKALVYLKRAAELPSPVRVKATYAHGLERAGKYKEAAQEWRKILKLAPNDRLAQRALKKLLAAGKIYEND